VSREFIKDRLDSYDLFKERCEYTLFWEFILL